MLAGVANVGKLGLFVNTQMSDDLVKQLSSYKAQLQQVEVALSTDPDNEDLLKLQKDLQVCVNNLDSYTNSSNLCSIALFIYLFVLKQSNVHVFSLRNLMYIIVELCYFFKSCLRGV